MSQPPQDFKPLVQKTQKLLREVQVQASRTGSEPTRTFFLKFCSAIEAGLQELKGLQQGALPADSKVKEIKDSEQLTEEYQPKANILGGKLYGLEKEYREVMESRHQAKADKGRQGTEADEADRLAGFIKINDHWLKHLYALEYSSRILKENLDSDQSELDKEPLPLHFRIERNKPSHSVRLIKASSKHPTSDDVTVLDIIDGCYRIPTFDRQGKQLVDDTDIIRFLRLHSEEHKLLDFKNDSLSRIASKMYDLLVQTIDEIKLYSKNIIRLINQTPIRELEYAYSGINPEEFRTLLRKKFQSLLPGINENHYRVRTGKKIGERSRRTIEITEEYGRDFQKMKQKVMGELKSTLAVSFWIRRVLTQVIRNNQALKRKEEKKEEKSEKKGKNNGEDKIQTKIRDHDNWIMVGASQTIGDEDIANFYIDPDHMISAEISIQRADRADKWIAVRKSDKMHCILKKDFFQVVQNFLDKDINTALKEYGFREVDFKNQLLPEIRERLEDETRIDLIRSGILGTTITNLDDFCENTRFHRTIRRYFQKPTYDSIHYPSSEKFSLICKDLSHSNTAILQMKYRKVLKVTEEIQERVKSLEMAVKEDMTIGRKKELHNQHKATRELKKIIDKVRQIMIFAKPSLKDVKLESEDDFVVIKGSDTVESLIG